MMLKIEYYSTNVGNFFRIASGSAYYRHNTLAANRIVEINSIDVRKLPLLSDWYHLDSELKDFKGSKPSTIKQVGWKLVNAEIASEKIPLELNMEELKKYYDAEDDEYDYSGDYAALSSLYEPKNIVLPEEIEDLEVELIKLRDLYIDNYNAPSEMKIELREGNYSEPIREADLREIAVFSDIERMLTPEFLLYTRPCELTSKQVYSIVRAHIQNNIDGKVARITSNYDFCFVVQKNIEHKPVEVKKEKLTSSGRSYKPPKFTSSTSSSKLVEIFSMTWAGAESGSRGYGTYSIIEGWKADSLQELYANMQQYLSDLMQEINKPVVECLHCNGTGCLTKMIDSEVLRTIAKETNQR